MRIKDHTDMVRHLTDPFNIPEARRMIQENPALTQEQFKAGGIVEPGVTHYAKFTNRDIAQIKKGLPEGINLRSKRPGEWWYIVEIEGKKEKGKKNRFIETKKLETGKENLDDLVEFREKTYKDLYPNRISDETFTKLRFEGKNSKLSDQAFADLLHKEGYTGSRGQSLSSKEGTGGRKIVMRLQDRLGWADEVGPLNFKSFDEVIRIL